MARSTTREDRLQVIRDKKSTGRTSKGYICNLVPSEGTETDWGLPDALDSGMLKAAPIPPSVDLRESWWDIGNQEQTGSCVGWATADGVGRYVMVKAGRITEDQRLSPRFIWMGSKETDDFINRPTSFVEEAGTQLKAAASLAHKLGFALESELPFHIKTTMYTGKENAFFASCAQRRINYVNLGLDVTAWKTWLATNGPIQAGLSVDKNWAELGSSGELDDFDASSILGGHAVCIAGYRKDGWFIVRNSWGTDWGDKGFAYVSPAYLQAAFFPESYGMVAG